MDEVRKPAVAGLFYPEDSVNLKRIISNFISSVPDEVIDYFKKNSINDIFSIIVPHAGYVYSGLAAAYGFSLIKKKKYDTVILIGPSHYTYFEGFALPYYKSFLTPLGEIEIDSELSHLIMEKGKGTFDYSKNAHLREHSLEVELPFLQFVLEGNFKILPILMGEQTIKFAQDGAEILTGVLSSYEKSYVIVVSSDLSHYHNSRIAEEMDRKCINVIKEMNARKLIDMALSGEIEACGAGPIATMLILAVKMNKENAKELIYTHSGYTSNDYDRVVGYTSIAIW